VSEERTKAPGEYNYLGTSRHGERRVWEDLNAWMHMQAQLWEPAGEQLLDELGDGTGFRAVDLGCGPLGWLRILSRWVGPEGEVVGTEIGDDTAEQARLTVRSEGLGNVRIVVDDVFNSRLRDASFDLVHARFMLGPIGRPELQLATYLRLLKRGGWLVLEDAETSSYRFNPSAPANERLWQMTLDWVARRGRTASEGRQIRTLLRPYSADPTIRAHVLCLPPGHAYRAYSVVAARAFRDALAEDHGAEAVDRLLEEAERELDDPEIWCTSFMLIQGFVRI
jgi:ubiquinone/menaquinone biosynthesis C-methylase UbiE